MLKFLGELRTLWAELSDVLAFVQAIKRPLPEAQGTPLFSQAAARYITTYVRAGGSMRARALRGVFVVVAALVAVTFG